MFVDCFFFKYKHRLSNQRLEMQLSMTNNLLNLFLGGKARLIIVFYYNLSNFKNWLFKTGDLLKEVQFIWNFL
jgi:hypothetical protein